MSWSMKTLFFLFTFFLATTSFANNPGVSYQGRIFKPDGNPLEGTTVQFRMQVRSPGSENCLLYEEVQTLNMAGSSGVFALTLNDGTGTRLDTATYQVDRIFANRETMTLDTTRCASGTTYAPNSSDGRKLVVYFKDETMAAYEAMPLMNLNYVPQAMYALEAQKVDKFAVSNILRAVDVSGNPVAAPALNPTQLTNLNTLLATPAANYVQTTSNGSVALPVVAGNPSSGLAAGQIWYDSGSNVMKYYDGAVKTFGTSGGGLSSVGLTLPAMFSVTNSPLTANGSITATLANQTANTVFAGPASGGPAAPTFRALASTDLPITGATGTFVNGGNSFGVAGNIGTNDAFDLNLKTNNTTKMTILSNGNVGIGTATPTSALDVGNGQVKAGSFSSGPIGLTVNGVGQNNTFLRGISSTTDTTVLIGSASGGVGGYINLWDATITQTVRLAGSGDSYLNGGNVGIGTTTPSSALEVSGDITVSKNVGGRSLNIANTNVDGENATSFYINGAHANGATAAQGGGIHISSGTGKLTGNGGTLDLSAGTSGNGGAGGPVNLLGGTASGDSSSTGGAVNIQGGLGKTTGGAVNILGGFTNTAGSSSPAGNVNITGGLAIAGNNNGGSIFLNGGPKSGTGSVGNIIMGNIGGNVGIGTTTPSAALQIGGSGRILVPSGDSSSPSFSFTGSTNTGLNLDSPNVMSFVAGGSAAQIFLNASTTPASLNGSDSGTFRLSLTPTNSNPAYSFKDDNNTGLQNPAADTISIVTGGTERARIDSSGNVGIGTTGPSTKLHVLGSLGATIATFADGGATTCTVTPASTGFACSSDERLKKNIETFSDAASLENILQLRTVTYDWRSVDNGRHTGFIAQELEKIAPEFVRTGEDGFKQVNYTGLVPWITGAIKAFYAEFKALSVEVKTSDENKSREIASVKSEANSRADKLEAQNSAIKQENAELRSRLDQQEKELAAIKNKLGL